MKKAAFSLQGILFLFFSFLAFISTPAQAQFYIWLPQKALTDSFADNINPSIASYFGSDYQYHSILFWERSIDSSGTAIYYKRLENGSPSAPTELLSTPGVHYTHPKVLVIPYTYPGNDTCLLLFFESDASGSKDLYFMKCYQNSNFTTPQLFSELPGNDQNLSVGGGNDQKFVVWENEGKLLESELLTDRITFSAPVILSGSGATSPAASDNMLSWIQQSYDSSNVMYMNRAYLSGGYTFQGPYEIKEQGDNSKLADCKGFPNFGGSNLMIWQNKISGAPIQLRLVDLGYSGTTMNVYGSGSYNYHSPDVFDFPIIIKFPTFITFVTDSLGNDEVMTSEPNFGGFNAVTNQSNFPGPDRNPHFFGTLNDYIFEIQLLWESLRNGHWTIFQTHYDMIFGLYENSASSPVTVYPNPFSEQTILKLSPALTVKTVTIYNMMNIPVRHLRVPAAKSQEEAEIVWDGNNDHGTRLPAGMYIIKYQTEKRIIAEKVIKY